MFGEVINGLVRLNEYGKIARDELIITEKKRACVFIDNFVIMPNHVHILITLHDIGNADVADVADTARRVPTGGLFGRPVRNSIPTIVGTFKSATTKSIREYVGTRRAVSWNAVSPHIPDVHVVWQGRYHDHIIRNELSYQKIYTYY